MKSMQKRDHMMLVGMFLSKFNERALHTFGFSTYKEAYNAFGYGLGGKPTSIKNYMQEFDPYFPNSRKGWHRRPMRAHCQRAFELYKDLSLSEFAIKIKYLTLFDCDQTVGLDEIAPIMGEDFSNSAFSKRLITGLAAEKFFEHSYRNVPEFSDCLISNVTSLGCGFDFQILTERSSFIAVEVKGVKSRSGSILMTDKEYKVAQHLAHRYYICIVYNFSEIPQMALYNNPIFSNLHFERVEKSRVDKYWRTHYPA